ncbi:hypothetical protein GMORB2_5004 [Geosmithia morbida]|uniref:Uncharacterized protein n=1 Tax=Geosmithia morbida TaxID=1094350 RepID=A0A9P5D1V2_9HYPO|nr:uncharacterized protein GMORB2_5004 [Geosmithia morbida]KAF4124338.1 hypothetical protein GMORB2_5004 [Geosmithia morbida]
MQTVPSLVGSGTAIATATTGLVIGEAADSPDFFFALDPPSSHPPSTSAAVAVPCLDHRSAYSYQTLHHPPSRPSTSLATLTDNEQNLQNHHRTLPPTPPVSRPPLSRYQRPKTSQFTTPRLSTRRQSLSKYDEPAVGPAAADAVRSSFSSTGSSWVRRLSLRPSSQHGSPRSSVGPDSIAFSHGSAAPVLSRRRSLVPPPTPNKLVKRSPPTPGYLHHHTPTTARPGTKSRTHLPSLRRPATSHQRTATLQRLQEPLYSPISPLSPTSPAIPATPADPDDRDSAAAAAAAVPAAHGLLPSALEKDSRSRVRSEWTSFFHSRIAGGQSANRIVDLDSQSQTRDPTPKRLRLFARHPQQRPYLVKPCMVSLAPQDSASASNMRQTSQGAEPIPPLSSSAGKPHQGHRARRSLSMSLSSATDWMARTSGSLRRSKRRDSHPTTPGPTSRHVVSDPLTPIAFQRDPVGLAAPRAVTSPDDFAVAPVPIPDDGPSSAPRRQPRRKKSSSPLRPLYSPSNDYDDELVRPKSSAGAAGLPLRQNQPSGSSTSSAALSHLRTHRRERSSTLDGSESELRYFTSGDEDTDFKSDTLFDSLRTGTSGRVRTVETPLDSMYDESPPSTAGRGRDKRLSIQDMLGKDWNQDDRILEEDDESAQTPRRTAALGGATLSIPAAEPGLGTDSGSRSTKGPPRFSMDDDFEDDWGQDHDDLPNALSPPSKTSMVNLRGVNPNVRLSMATSISSFADSTHDQRSERPLSSLFDWSETPAHDKQEHSGRSRPKTAYAKQETDARGGRSVNRKGPAPAHVRSQSVPIVNDGPEESKPAGSKYGTWGIGAKTISEDWDDDFEFGGGDVDDDNKDDDRLFAVPESIQASQPSVRAHSGQIRELSLLVNDLRRLCRHGRDLDLLHGPQATLWKEAEGIIALASPDDDSLESDRETTSSIDLDAFDAHDRLPDDDFDSASIDKLDAALDGREPAMSKTAVVRDRPSPRRRSVFSPDDDIFGGGSLPASESGNGSGNGNGNGNGKYGRSSSRPSRPRTPESRLSKPPPDVNGVVRSVVEVMQQRTMTEALLDGHSNIGTHHHQHSNKKMHFDTSSLRLLVKRAADLRDLLSEAVRRADQITQSPMRTPRRERHPDSSPAFTKVFDDPGSSPPRQRVRSRGNTTMVEGSPENSPSSGMGRRMMMV